MRNWWIPVLFVLVFIAAAALMSNVANLGSDATSWSELKQLVRDGGVASVRFDGPVLHAERTSDDPELGAIRVPVVQADDGFVLLLEEHGVPYSSRAPNVCADGAAGYLLISLAILAAMFFLLTRQGGAQQGAAAFGRSTARVAPEEGVGVTFKDVAGVPEAVEELQEVIAFLTTPEKFTALGGRPPKGVLLVGPPGTGKTLLARAVAGEARVPFFSISGSAFVEMFVGVGAARVRDLFGNAEEHAPCIIFIDELDAVGKARGAGGPSGNEEREQTLNQLLVEMDGFDNRRGIIVMAATNRPETLDRALLRPGRFDRQVLVDRPDLKGRLEILEVHAAKVKLEEGVDLEAIAQLTPGFAGADLANILNEAALLAARRDAKAVTTSDIQDAIERVIAGLEKKNRRMSEREKRVVAFHECGHAICAAASPGADPVRKISIIPRGIAALGYTVQLPLEDRYLMSKAELLNRITTLYGGRAAEEIVFGDVTTGASDDLRRATDLARRMVTEYGMSRTVGAIHYGDDGNNAFGLPSSPGRGTGASETIATTIDQEVRAIMRSCHERSQQILFANRVVLEEMSLALLQVEVLDGEPMTAFLDRVEQAVSLSDLPTGEISNPLLPS
jgi:cell division protease FtsH